MSESFFTEYDRDACAGVPSHRQRGTGAHRGIARGGPCITSFLSFAAWPRFPAGAFFNESGRGLYLPAVGKTRMEAGRSALVYMTIGTGGIPKVFYFFRGGRGFSINNCRRRRFLVYFIRRTARSGRQGAARHGEVRSGRARQGRNGTGFIGGRSRWAAFLFIGWTGRGHNGCKIATRIVQFLKTGVERRK